jgi:hypothetical protein
MPRRVPALVPARGRADARRDAFAGPGGRDRAMIDRAVGLVAARLEAHLRARFGIVGDIVAVSGLTGADGQAPPSVCKRLALFVTGITRETTSRAVPGRSPAVARRSPIDSVHLNVHLMLASSFDPESCLESLKILSHAIRFLQVHRRFDRTNAPEIDRCIEQLSLEIETLDTEAASQLRGILGGRYLPSVQYRMRTVTIDAGALPAAVPIHAPETRAEVGA